MIVHDYIYDFLCFLKIGCDHNSVFLSCARVCPLTCENRHNPPICPGVRRNIYATYSEKISVFFSNTKFVKKNFLRSFD